MTITDLIEKLNQIKKTEGDIEVTCTHSLRNPEPGDKDIFETTVENTEVHDHPTVGRCVRLWL